MKLSNHHKVYISLGVIATSFATLEQIMYMTISAIAGIRFDLCLSMLVGDNFDTLIKVLDSVHGHVTTKIKPTIETNKEFQDILKLLRDVKERRNIYFHSQWDLTKDSETTVWKWTKGKKGKSVQTVANKITAEELDNLIRDINVVSHNLQQFYTKYFIKR